MSSDLEVPDQTETKRDPKASLVLVLDLEGRIVLINEACQVLTGREQSEVRGRQIWDCLVPPEEAAAMKDSVAELLRGHAVGAQSCSLIDRRGDRRRVSWSHTLLRDFAGEPQLLICTGADLSLETAARADAEERQARLQAILESAVDAIITINDGGVIESLNPAAEQLFGYPVAEMIGHNISLLMPEPDRSAHDGYIRRYLDTGERRIIGAGREVTARRKDGSTFPASLSVSEVVFDGRRLFTGIIHDNSARRAAEEQLHHAQKMEAVGQLTGGIAHDFNNLLTVVIGNLEMLETRVTDDKSRSLVRQAEEAAELGAELIDRLLTFARRRSLEPQSLDLNELILGLDDILRRALGEAIDLSIVLSPGLWQLRSDPGQLENAILNLCLNARDALGDGGRVTIETANADVDGAAMAGDPEVSPGSYVRLSVSDSGPGMVPEVRARAFEPFFTTKEPGVGTGLGLSMVYGFARQSGGFATIRSETGQGTTVSLFLPRWEGTLAEAAPVGSEGEGAEGQGETVLVVEDDDRVREITAQRLRTLGYRVREAGNGQAALEALEEHDGIELLFTDIVMPGGMSGRELAVAVRKRHPGVKVLYTSGYAAEAAAQRGALGPGEALLAKPYRTAELAVQLRRILDRD
ncbi:MAG: PAS domain S-box protein [Kiloniellales bacterium]|nr:PAS domain S-box protein [Kiloniellales bacterium]MDJ0980783.1 PAS domain S-box protein [Kiloniellales bacterium]